MQFQLPGPPIVLSTSWMIISILFIARESFWTPAFIIYSPIEYQSSSMVQDFLFLTKQTFKWLSMLPKAIL